MTDDPRDELDRALAARLGAMTADDTDAAAVLEDMRPGLRRARTRHRVGRVSAVVAALAVVVSLVAVVSSTSTRHGSVAVNSSSTTIKPLVPVPVSPTPPKTHDVTTTTQPHAAGPTTTAPSGHPEHGPAVTVPAVPTNPNPGGGGGSNPPATTPPPAPLTYQAPGGSLTLTCAGSRLTLVSYAANSGWSADPHKTEAQEIEIRFSQQSDDGGISGRDSAVHASEDAQSFIDVRVGSSGCAQLQVQTQ